MAVTFTETTQGHLVKKVKAVWVSDSDGAATGATTYTYDGLLYNFMSIPDGGGTAPTAAYDITLTDPNGVDLLQGAGADRSATAREYVNTSDGLGTVSEEKLTLTIANAGEAKGGTVYFAIING